MSLALERQPETQAEYQTASGLPVERVYADPKVKADVGRVALQRGPVVYCLEGADNQGHVRNLCLPRTASLRAHFEKKLLGGVVVIHGTCADGSIMTAIPNYARLNRGGRSVVWMRDE